MNRKLRALFGVILGYLIGLSSWGLVFILNQQFYPGQFTDLWRPLLWILFFGTFFAISLGFKFYRGRKPETVWVVYHGAWEGETETVHAICHAICHSSELAEKARIRLAAELQNPIKTFEVAEVATNAVHLYGILVQAGSFNIEKRGKTQ